MEDWDSVLKWGGGLLIALVVISAIGWIRYENVKSWEQSDACNAKGGVMITAGTIDGCVRIISISTGQ